MIENILIILVGFLVGVIVLGFFLHKKKVLASFETAQLESKHILEEARKEADHVIKNALRESKEESRLRRKNFEEESKKRKTEMVKLEKKIKHRETLLTTRQEAIEEREAKSSEKEKKLAVEEKRHLRLLADYEITIEKNQRTLEKIANMSAEEAKKELTRSVEDEARKEAQKTIRKIEQEARKDANLKALEIVSLSIQRMAGEYVNDSTVTVVTLPSEEMKGRIIGREGRNIRALEQATGVDLIIDDTPEAVILSCFNPIRREIAKITLERLIADGRIHPARIEETAKRVELEFQGLLRESGEQAAFDAGITDLHPEILSLLGKLRFRHVGLQSVLQHSIETSHICSMMASEMGLNVKKAKRAGLLHDIGKAVDQGTEGHHADISANVCEQYGEHKDIVEAVKLHHGEELLNASPLAVILGAANTLSVNRPGARKEILATYIKRLEDMEAIVTQFKGIHSAFVLQAGREVRALITPEDHSDEDVRNISNEIAIKLRQELTFPGQVRITILKESKHVDYAT